MTCSGARSNRLSFQVEMGNTRGNMLQNGWKFACSRSETEERWIIDLAPHMSGMTQSETAEQSVYGTEYLDDLIQRIIEARDASDILNALQHHTGGQHNWKLALQHAGLTEQQWDSAMNREGWTKVVSYTAKARGIPKFSHEAEAARTKALDEKRQEMAMGEQFYKAFRKVAESKFGLEKDMVTAAVRETWNFQEGYDQVLQKINQLRSDAQANQVDSSAYVGAALEILSAARLKVAFRPAIERDALKFLRGAITGQQLLRVANELIGRSEGKELKVSLAEKTLGMSV